MYVLVLIRMYAYARLREEVSSIRTWLCIRWPLSVSLFKWSFDCVLAHILTIVEFWLLADVVYDPEFYSFSFSWSNTSGSIWCSPIQRRWQTLVLIVFDTAFGSLPQSIEDEAKKGESCTHWTRYHSSRDRLVVVLISWLRVCVCVCFTVYVCSVDWICLQSDEHTREKGKKRKKERWWI